MTETTTDDRLVFPERAWPKLRDALQHIADHPDEFYMGEYVASGDRLTDRHIADIVKATGHPFPECGTVACLAGRIALLDGADTDVEARDPERALEALGIDVSAYERIGGGSSFWIHTYTELRDALEGVFQMTWIHTYAELQDALEASFTFPEPLPVPTAVTS